MARINEELGSDGEAEPRHGDPVYLDGIRAGGLVQVGTFLSTSGATGARERGAVRDAQEHRRAHDRAYLSGLAIEREVVHAAMQAVVGPTYTEAEYDFIFALLRGGLDSAHCFDAVRGAVAAAARLTTMPRESDAETAFIYGLLRLHWAQN